MEDNLVFFCNLMCSVQGPYKNAYFDAHYPTLPQFSDPKSVRLTGARELNPIMEYGFAGYYTPYKSLLAPEYRSRRLC